MDQIYLSKEMRDVLINNTTPDKNKIHVGGYEIPVHESPLFPIEVHYDACDVQTKEAIKVGSGEMIHGVMVNTDDFEKIQTKFEFEEPFLRDPFKSYMEMEWGRAIFK